jgi:hypothetical protein
MHHKFFWECYSQQREVHGDPHTSTGVILSEASCNVSGQRLGASAWQCSSTSVATQQTWYHGTSSCTVLSWCHTMEFLLLPKDEGPDAVKVHISFKTEMQISCLRTSWSYSLSIYCKGKMHGTWTSEIFAFNIETDFKLGISCPLASPKCMSLSVRIWCTQPWHLCAPLFYFK